MKRNVQENVIHLACPADDESRVVLEKMPGDEFSDYINANYIEVGILGAPT